MAVCDVGGCSRKKHPTSQRHGRFPGVLLHLSRSRLTACSKNAAARIDADQEPTAASWNTEWSLSFMEPSNKQTKILDATACRTADDKADNPFGRCCIDLCSLRSLDGVLMLVPRLSSPRTLDPVYFYISNVINRACHRFVRLQDHSSLIMFVDE
jgi:hypothetical protein